MKKKDGAQSVYTGITALAFGVLLEKYFQATNGPESGLNTFGVLLFVGLPLVLIVGGLAQLVLRKTALSKNPTPAGPTDVHSSSPASRSGARYCTACGERLAEAVRYCPACGQQSARIGS